MNLAVLDEVVRHSQAFTIPAWFGITTDAFDQFIAPALADCKTNLERIEAVEFPREMMEKIQSRRASVFSKDSHLAGFLSSIFA